MTVTDWITITLAVVGIIVGMRLFFLGPELKAGAEGKGETAEGGQFLCRGTRLPTSDGEHAKGLGGVA